MKTKTTQKNQRRHLPNNVMQLKSRELSSPLPSATSDFLIFYYTLESSPLFDYDVQSARLSYCHANTLAQEMASSTVLSVDNTH